MSAEVKKEIALEIAHVLFIDIVGYSKLSINDQHAAVEELNQIVRASEQFQKGEATERLLKIPTGDGMALVFYSSPEAPAQCAVEISRALKEHPRLQLRMGIHSGPVSGVVDVNQRANLAGAGINIAQRAMDCGDAGHILLSKHVAEDLSEYDRWRPLLHELGTCEVKHGVRIEITNLYSDEVGNAQLPKKFQVLKRRRTQQRLTACIALIGALAIVWVGRDRWARRDGRPPTPAGSLPVAEKSIAVLPFENLSANQENAFFTDGVQDEILSYLAKVADLKVISRTSVMQYKSGIPRNVREIGQQLGVAHVLEGSVQRSNNRIRVMAQLIDARNDAHLWAEHYDRDIADIFAIQSEIAKAIADQLQAKLSPSEKAAIEQAPTADVAAFDLYSRARTLFSLAFTSDTGRQDVLHAVDLLNQAVARAPSFLQAYCLLANTHDYFYFFGVDHNAERLALAEAALKAAFRLQPDSGEAHRARAQHLYWGYLDYESALAELEIARRTLPNDSDVFAMMGNIQRRQGHWEESVQNHQRAVELAPRQLDILENAAGVNHQMRRYAESATLLDRALAIKPDDAAIKAGRGFLELDWKADTRPLHQTIDSIREKNPAAIQSVASFWLICALAERDAAAAADALVALGENDFDTVGVQFSRTFAEGLLAQMTKDEAKARSAFAAARAQQEKIVQTQPNHGPSLCALGLIDAGLGRKEDALSEGRRAIALVPVEKNALDGAIMIGYFAMIAAWVGEKDLACEHLAIATRLPSPLSYGQLKLLPDWDPLRGDPRFEKIVQSLAPKETK